MGIAIAAGRAVKWRSTISVPPVESWLALAPHQRYWSADRRRDIEWTIYVEGATRDEAQAAADAAAATVTRERGAAEPARAGTVEPVEPDERIPVGHPEWLRRAVLRSSERLAAALASDARLIARIRDLPEIEPRPGWEARAVERWQRERGGS